MPRRNPILKIHPPKRPKRPPPSRRKKPTPRTTHGPDYGFNHLSIPAPIPSPLTPSSFLHTYPTFHPDPPGTPNAQTASDKATKYAHLIHAKLVLVKRFVVLEREMGLDRGRAMHKDQTARALAEGPIVFDLGVQEVVRDLVWLKGEIEQQLEMGRGEDAGEKFEGKGKGKQKQKDGEVQWKDEHELLEERMQELLRKYWWAWEYLVGRVVGMCPLAEGKELRDWVERVVDKVLGRMFDVVQ